MEEQKAFEDIEFIKKIISDSRSLILGTWVPFIVWGFIVLAGLTATIIQYYFRMEIGLHWVWSILIGGGWVYTIVEEYALKQRYRPITYGGKILTAVWISCGIAMTIYGFVATTAEAISSVFVSPVLSVVLGIAYFLTGVIIENKFIKFISIGWWLGSIVMFFSPGIQTIIIMAAMIILFQIIPGFVMGKSKKEAKLNNE